MENPAGTPRFTFGVPDLLGGIEAVPALVGVFAPAEVMRALTRPPAPPVPDRRFGSILKGQWALTKKYQVPMWRGNLIGVIIGVLPGAGADMAAWVSYAMSKKFSKEAGEVRHRPPGRAGGGGRVQQRLARPPGWVPSLLFGIPGDTITAIAIGVLYMKGLNPGPTLFTERASSMYALYIIFILANIIMIPLGIGHDPHSDAGAAGAAGRGDAGDPAALLRGRPSPRGNKPVRGAAGGGLRVSGFVMERNGYPVARHGCSASSSGRWWSRTSSPRSSSPTATCSPSSSGRSPACWRP
jgi:hypothetical protein